MGFNVKIEGNETIDLKKASIKTVLFKTDTPDDSNARSTDLGVTITISGKILAAVGGDNTDDTMKMATWSLVPAEKADCYRKVTVEVIAADQMVRKFSFPNAFVVDYTENYGDTEGTGTFELIVKQKKDKLPDVKIEGGYKA
ncbi:MAG: membrane-associated protease 1 [Pelosinus sp.]|nr:membrane-associated protease 1 [Pelosinus sp.]